MLSHYVFSEFENGTIFMKDGSKIDIPLNFNSASEQIVFIRNGQKLALADETILNVDSVFIRNKKFVLVEDKFMEKISGINYDLFIEYKCKVTPPREDKEGYGVKSRTASINTYHRAYGPGGIYELKLPEDFIVKPYVEYKVKIKDKIYSFNSVRQLLKLYSNQKQKVNNYTSVNEIDINNIENIRKFIQYMQID